MLSWTQEDALLPLALPGRQRCASTFLVWFLARSRQQLSRAQHGECDNEPAGSWRVDAGCMPKRPHLQCRCAALPASGVTAASCGLLSRPPSQGDPSGKQLTGCND